MAMKTKRLKAAAAVYASQTRDDAIKDIKAIGDMQRELVRLETLMNDEINIITARYAPELEERKKQLATLQKGVQAWCEANRDELTNHGKTKTANLITGEVSWRVRPPSVSVRGIDLVLETLERLNLSRFIRQKTEVNKEAILAEPDAVRGVAGIIINSGVEDFAIVPFEQDSGM